MIKNSIIYCFAALTLLLTSCDKWLTVNPEYQVVDTELFSRPQGFHSAINGVYINLSNNALYGSNLSWGNIEGWARVYKLSTGSHDTSIALRDLKYDQKGVVSFGESVWRSGYNVISQCNDILANVETKDATFFDKAEAEKSMIKGEALAIRAMMHFDIARIFADSPAIDIKKIAVPYVDKYPSKINQPLPLDVVLGKCVEDLEAAQALLFKYDMGTPQDSSLLFSGDFRIAANAGTFYSNRGTRMNYLAVTALLARVHLYAKNYEKAHEYAMKIVGYVRDKKLAFTVPGSLITDPMSRLDVLFGFYNKKQVEGYNNTISPSNTSSSYSRLDETLYKSTSTDKRSGFWTPVAGVSTVFVLSRYYNKSTADFQSNLLPNIRIGECYYIAAEALTQIGAATEVAEAAALLTEIRKTRGVTAANLAVKPEQVEQMLIQEYRRELVGEGQLLFFFKRKNIPIYFETESATAMPKAPGFNHQGKLTLPYPDSELGV